MNQPVKVIGLVILGLALCAAGITVGETDDAPGAALLGFLSMLAAMCFAVKIARRNGGAT